MDNRKKLLLRKMLVAVESGDTCGVIKWSALMWPNGKLFELSTLSDQVMRAYYGSLDAAKALHDAVLPDWYWSIFAETVTVFLMREPHDGNSYSCKSDGDPARSWLIAIIKALIAQEGE